MVSNYRTISILPVFSKVIEKCICERLTKFFAKFSVLTPSQFGFRSNVSTQDAIIRFTELVYDAINSKNLLVLFSLIIERPLTL